MEKNNEKGKFVRLEPVQKYMIVFDNTDSRWKMRNIMTNHASYENHIPCNSQEEAILHLRVHQEIPVGIAFRLTGGIAQDLVLIKE